MSRQLIWVLRGLSILIGVFAITSFSMAGVIYGLFTLFDGAASLRSASAITVGSLAGVFSLAATAAALVDED